MRMKRLVKWEEIKLFSIVTSSARGGDDDEGGGGGGSGEVEEESPTIVEWDTGSWKDCTTGRITVAVSKVEGDDEWRHERCFFASSKALNKKRNFIELVECLLIKSNLCPLFDFCFFSLDRWFGIVIIKFMHTHIKHHTMSV